MGATLPHHLVFEEHSISSCSIVCSVTLLHGRLSDINKIKTQKEIGLQCSTTVQCTRYFTINVQHQSQSNENT